jgi:DNA-binding FrmR family transcriptional regulator
MTHLSRGRQLLIARSRKIQGQLESVERGLSEDARCADILQRLAAARGAINSLMGELMEGHIRSHMGKNAKASEDAAEDLIEIVRSYLK